MAFNGITLKTDYPQNEYPYKQQDIANINRIFEPFGLHVDDVKEGSQVIRYIIHLPLDIQIQGKIRRAAKDIEYTLISALKTSDVSYSHIEDTLVIERRGMFNIIPFGKLYTVDFECSSTMTTAVLGQDMNGDPVYLDIAKAPHILVAGTTGSGKSETMHSIIASLIMHNIYSRISKERVIINIIDMKGTEYNKYRNAPVEIINDEETAFSHLEELCRKMEARYQMFAENNCDDIEEFIQKGNRLSRTICFIDEFADLILRNRKVEDYVVRLAQKSRACGIHLVIGTQSPRADVVTGLVKANVPCRIALNTSNSMESRIILDEVGAEKLLGKGDMLIKIGGQSPIRVQGCFVCDSDKINLTKLSEKTYGKTIIIPTKSPQDIKIQLAQNTPPKKVGLIQGLKNIWNAPQCTTPRDYWTILND